MAQLEDARKQKYEKPNIKGDGINIVVLTLSYILQGALGGLNTGAFPIFLHNRKVSYADQVRSSIFPFIRLFSIIPGTRNR